MTRSNCSKTHSSTPRDLRAWKRAIETPLNTANEKTNKQKTPKKTKTKTPSPSP